MGISWGSTLGAMHRRDRLIELLLGAGLLAFYITVQYGDFWGWDGRTMANVTHNLVEQQAPVVTPDVAWFVNEFPNPDGSPAKYSPFGIGLSVALIPFWLLQRAIDPDHGYWLTLYNPLVTAVTAVVLYRIGRALEWRPLTRVLTALMFGLLTQAPAYSVEIFNEPTVALCLAVAVLGSCAWARASMRDGGCSASRSPWPVCSDTSRSCWPSRSWLPCRGSRGGTGFGGTHGGG